jgi:hypothetical protein
MYLTKNLDPKIRNKKTRGCNIPIVLGTPLKPFIVTIKKNKNPYTKVEYKIERNSAFPE